MNFVWKRTCTEIIGVEWGNNGSGGAANAGKQSRRAQRKLTDALQAVNDKGTELNAQVAFLTTTREQLDCAQANVEHIWSEAD